MPVWQVSDRPVSDQFSYWREVICQAFVPLTTTPRPGYRSGFRGAVEAHQLGFLNPSTLGSQPQETLHGPDDVRRTTDDCCYVNLQLSGTCGVRQRRQESLVRPGQFTIVDTTEPYAFDLQGQWRIMSFRVPRSALRMRVADIEQVLGRSFDGTAGIGAVVGSLMSALWNLGDLGAGPEPGALQESFVSAVSAVLRPVPTGDGDTEAQRTALRSAILAFVEGNLAEPQLSVAAVAKRFAISPRTLHQVFANHEESFASAVRSMRLEACARRLSDPACDESITDVAARYGSVDPSSFSRAFWRRFGVNPRDLRNHPQR